MVPKLQKMYMAKFRVNMSQAFSLLKKNTIHFTKIISVWKDICQLIKLNTNKRNHQNIIQSKVVS